MPHDLPKAYDPAAIEQRWAEFWDREQLFHVATPAAGDAARVYTLLLPPPNVTGRLHMGHMLNHTEMDIIMRWRRMNGWQALWLPGTDHAGIATQMMVERQLAEEGKQRQDLGRDGFVARVWEWKQQYGGAIVEQMRRIGDTVDWQREYFTMDEKLSPAVRAAFVALWDDGLIYRGRYIVNWCPRCGTAISDLEVVHEEVNGKLYEIKYPVEGTNEFITVATTRPETMLGDTAVAVNASDERYKHLHGKTIRLPLMDRQIPIILDELANPEFGTGAVKVTPAHDPNDFQAGKRHDLPQIDVMDETARMNQNAGAYAGLDRFEARERVLNDLRERGLLVAVKDHVIPLGKCQRCRTIVEPRLSTQWFIAVNKEPKSGGLSMAERARRAATTGAIRFTPENYKAIYLNWMNGIYDWCISRQLWWGHRIPAWHCAACREITVARQDPAKCQHCGSAKLEQDTDVLDTWFSSGLLPCTVFGWPEHTRDAAAFYPTSLLITGFDILFFWVARMIMLGCHFMKDHQQDTAIKRASCVDTGDSPVSAREAGALNPDSVPFREVYIHSLVRDAERQKMSKTKGNVVDPIEVLQRYGTDALRFTLAIKAAPGTDIAFNEKDADGYRAFANKIWNAARFIFMNVDRAQESGAWSLAEFARVDTGDSGVSDAPSFGALGQGSPVSLSKFKPVALEDHWILSRFHRTAQQVNEALMTYRFHEASGQVYHFFWGEFCDWYIELAKLRMNAGTDEAAKKSTAQALDNIVSLFEASVRLLAPFMPFLADELWHAIYDGKPPQKSVALATYPQAEATQINDGVEADMALLQELIVSIRNLRAEMRVEMKARAPIQLFGDAPVRTLVEQNRGALEKLANVEGVEFVAQSLAGRPNTRSSARFDVAVVYHRAVDTVAERERLNKELEKMRGELGRAQAQLGNQGFLAKAPAKVVEGLQKREGELKVLIEKAERALGELGT